MPLSSLNILVCRMGVLDVQFLEAVTKKKK